MTEKEYNQAPGVRRSDLWRMHESPEKYKWFLEHPPESTPTLTFGAAAHKMLLEPDGFNDEFAILPNVDRRTKAGKEAYEAFLTDKSEKTVITQDDYATIVAMTEKANSIPYVHELLKGEHEKSFFWDDPDTGERCKVRADIITAMDGKVTIADYKTAANAKTEIFNNDIFRYGYHLQAYMYTEAVMQSMHLTERPDFLFVVQEKKAPYAVNLVQVTEDVMLAGMDTFRELIGTLHQCKETGFWYGYTGIYGEPNEAFLPGWMQMGDEEV